MTLEEIRKKKFELQEEIKDLIIQEEKVLSSYIGKYFKSDNIYIKVSKMNNFTNNHILLEGLGFTFLNDKLYVGNIEMKLLSFKDMEEISFKLISSISLNDSSFISIFPTYSLSFKDMEEISLKEISEQDFVQTFYETMGQAIEDFNSIIFDKL